MLGDKGTKVSMECGAALKLLLLPVLCNVPRYVDVVLVNAGLVEVGIRDASMPDVVKNNDVAGKCAEDARTYLEDGSLVFEVKL
jgi:hypothetical protein